MDTSALIGIVGGLAGICVSGISILTFWMKFSDRIATSEADAQAAGKQASIALARVIDVEKELVEHRVAVAREYVSKDTLATLESRVIDAINSLGQRLDNLFKQNRN